MADIVGTLASGNNITGNLGAVLGKDGLSAYEVAVKNGFEGSEVEWLESLKGKIANIEEVIQSVVSQINKISTVTLPSSGWVGEASPYSQIVNIQGATENSKIDLNPTIEQLSIFHEKDIAFVVGNENGVIRVYCIGQKPTNDYTIQVSITEVKRYE